MLCSSVAIHAAQASNKAAQSTSGAVNILTRLLQTLTGTRDAGVPPKPAHCLALSSIGTAAAGLSPGSSMRASAATLQPNSFEQLLRRRLHWAHPCRASAASSSGLLPPVSIWARPDAAAWPSSAQQVHLTQRHLTQQSTTILASSQAPYSWHRGPLVVAAAARPGTPGVRLPAKRRNRFPIRRLTESTSPNTTTISTTNSSSSNNGSRQDSQTAGAAATPPQPATSTSTVSREQQQGALPGNSRATTSSSALQAPRTSNSLGGEQGNGQPAAAQQVLNNPPPGQPPAATLRPAAAAAAVPTQTKAAAVGPAAAVPAETRPAAAAATGVTNKLAPWPNESEVLGAVVHIRWQDASNHKKIIMLEASRVQPAHPDVGKRFGLVGVLPGVNPGLRMRAVGSWQENQQHGWTFNARGFEVVVPKTSDEIVEYLTSILKGVGPKTAKAIVDTLGPSVVTLLSSSEAEKHLRKVPGIKAKRAAAIKQQWDEGAAHHTTVEELVRLGLPHHLAHRVQEAHGPDAAHLVRSDPHLALLGVPGATWRLMEGLAAASGKLAGDLPGRGAAALVEALVKAARDAGDTHLTWRQLKADALGLMGHGPSGGAARWWPAPAPLEPAVQLLLQRGLITQLEPAGSPSSSTRSSRSSSDTTSWEEEEEGEEGGGGGALLAAAARAAAGAGRGMEQLGDRGGSSGSNGAAAGSWEEEGEGLHIDDNCRFMLPQLAAAQADLVEWLTTAAAHLTDSSTATWRGRQAKAVTTWLKKYEQQLSKAGVQMSTGQRHAIRTCLTSKVSVLTGGPGCGKTWATTAMLKYWQSKNLNIAACAPTGRAAQRLAELVHTAGIQASTIHRLLGYSGQRPADTDSDADSPPGDATPPTSPAVGSSVDGSSGSSSGPGGGEGDLLDELDVGSCCVFGKDKSLPADVVLVDEASMLTLPLAAALCNALKSDAQLVLVGDPDQLPPVGAGAPLRDIIQAGTVPVTHLLELFRQEAGSAIVSAARDINAGQFPGSLYRVQLQPPAAGLYSQQQQQQQVDWQASGWSQQQQQQQQPWQRPLQHQQQQPWAQQQQQQQQQYGAAAAAAPAQPGSTPVNAGPQTAFDHWKMQLLQLVSGSQDGTEPAADTTTTSSSGRRPTSSSGSSGGSLGVLPGAVARGLPSDGLLLELPPGRPCEEVGAVVAAVVGGLLPHLGYDNKQDVQVLSPTKKAAAGVVELNERLQPLVNPPTTQGSITTKGTNSNNNHSSNGSSSPRNLRGGSPSLPSLLSTSAAAAAAFQVGDRVMQMRNNMDKDVFNGDMGTVTQVSPDGGVWVAYARPGRADADEGDHVVVYEGKEARQQLQRAWATTVHKAQGGEFPVVVVPLHDTMYFKLLNRTLLYTAVTRAKQLVVVVATQEAVRRCLQRDHHDTKQTSLQAALQEAAAAAGLPQQLPARFESPAGASSSSSPAYA